MARSSCEKAAMAARTLLLRVLEIALDDYRRGLEKLDYFESASFQKVCDVSVRANTWLTD